MGISSRRDPPTPSTYEIWCIILSKLYIVWVDEFIGGSFRGWKRNEKNLCKAEWIFFDKSISLLLAYSSMVNICLHQRLSVKLTLLKALQVSLGLLGELESRELQDGLDRSLHPKYWWSLYFGLSLRLCKTNYLVQHDLLNERKVDEFGELEGKAGPG